MPFFLVCTVPLFVSITVSIRSWIRSPLRSGEHTRTERSLKGRPPKVCSATALPGLHVRGGAGGPLAVWCPRALPAWGWATRAGPRGSRTCAFHSLGISVFVHDKDTLNCRESTSRLLLQLIVNQQPRSLLIFSHLLVPCGLAGCFIVFSVFL